MFNVHYSEPKDVLSLNLNLEYQFKNLHEERFLSICKYICVCKWEVPLRVWWLSNTIHSHAENLHSNPSCKKIFKKMSGSLIYPKKKKIKKLI